MNNEISKYPFFDAAAICLVGDLLVKSGKSVVVEHIEDKKEMRFDMTRCFGILLKGDESMEGDR